VVRALYITVDSIFGTNPRTRLEQYVKQLILLLAQF